MSIRNWSITTKRLRNSAAAFGLAGTLTLGALAAGGVFAQPSDAQVVGTGTIVTAGSVGANCRADASTDAQFLTLVPDGSTVEVTGEAKNGFLPVICNGQAGWIFEPLVTNIIPATPAVTEAASPAATAVASPVAAQVPAWVATYAIDPSTTVDGDSTTVGVAVSADALEPNVTSFETRPFVVFQTTNNTEADTTLVLFSAPEGTDATGFTIPAEESALPEGVKPVSSFTVKPGETVSAILKDLAEGTYILADTNGQAVALSVNPQAAVDVPDIFASPEATEAAATPAATEAVTEAAATPAATEAAATPAVEAAPAWIANYAIDPSTTVDGDSTTVGVAVGADALEPNVTSFETRPFVVFQTTNNTEADATLVLFSAPEGTDATGFTVPAEESALPEGVKPVSSFTVKPGETVSAIVKDLPEGTYVLADTTGHAVTLTVNPQAAVDVPDIFASPEATAAPATPVVVAVTEAPTEVPTQEPTATTEPTATEVPTQEPTATEVPTQEPTATTEPTEVPATPVVVETEAASPVASPAASPVAGVPAWVATYALDPSVKVDGDSVTVGVKDGADALEINAASLGAKPFVVLQTTNETDKDVTYVLFSAPEGTETEGFTIPADESALPDGVKPVASFTVKPGETTGAVLADLPEGTYVLATTDGKAVTFTVTPAAVVDVPDIFASPEGTPTN